MVGYRRLLDKHKALTERAEQEVKAHATKVARILGELNEETQGYTDYHQNVCRGLRQLHEYVASSFAEVKAQCLPFPGKGVKKR
jgi:hypothetical protein